MKKFNTAGMLAVLMLVTFVPEVVLFIPNLLLK